MSESDQIATPELVRERAASSMVTEVIEYTMIRQFAENDAVSQHCKMYGEPVNDRDVFHLEKRDVARRIVDVLMTTFKQNDY